jgi:hypothetical protein
MVYILDDGGYVKVVEDYVNREIVVTGVLSSELSNGGALSYEVRDVLILLLLYLYQYLNMALN